MTYKLNTLGQETIRNFIYNNGDTNSCMDEYFAAAEKTANSTSFKGLDSVGAVLLLKHQTIHRYEVLLMLRKEHYDNV